MTPQIVEIARPLGIAVHDTSEAVLGEQDFLTMTFVTS